MSHAPADQSSTCFLCGSAHLKRIDYLNFNSESSARNLAYALPRPIARLLSKMSHGFSAAYYPVAVNKKYFDRSASYCLDCRTGSCQPFFEKEVLANYYREFYWTNRDVADGQHVTHEARPNDRQLALSRERILWVRKYLPHFETVIDFGAGDCAASYILACVDNLEKVHVVDPSVRAGLLANSYGLGYSDDLAEAPIVDLIYSAHSIEHVHDLRSVMQHLMTKMTVGSHVFFETPNIGDEEIFTKLAHTPHTFMLSQGSFCSIESEFPLRIVAMESCGPMWRRKRNHIRSDEKADLRVLMQKSAEFKPDCR